MSIASGSRLLLLAAAGLAANGCIAHSPHRTFDNENLPARPASHCAGAPVAPAPDCGPGTTSDPALTACTSIDALQADGVQADRHRLDVGCVSHELHAPLAGSATSLPHAGFDLHVMEFDDEGRPWNRARQDETFKALDRKLEKPAVVLVFVHGWKNDSAICNGNLSCFRDVLEILSKAETAFAGVRPGAEPRRVVGVYIGWRGGSISDEGLRKPAKPLKQATFWGRKHAAHVVGDNGAVSAVVERLRTMVADKREKQTGRGAMNAFRETSLVFVGHSFGAALLYSALATSINARVGAAIEQVPASQRYAAFQPGRATAAQTSRQPMIAEQKVCVPSGGDLVVLVNPAMEASRFANLNQVRNLEYDAKQVPIFMTLASENDQAVGGFFPIGQSFATLARAARSRETWLSMITGFGLYAPFHTHRLALKPSDEVPGRERVSGTCRCKSNLRAFGDALVLRLSRLYEAVEAGSMQTLALASYQELLYSTLEPVRDVDPHNPFIMATVDPEVVADHSDIFNVRFLDFLVEFVIRTEIKRAQANDYRTAGAAGCAGGRP